LLFFLLLIVSDGSVRRHALYVKLFLKQVLAFAEKTHDTEGWGARSCQNIQKSAGKSFQVRGPAQSPAFQ